MHPADEFLSHYGVAGMKWGKRKARTHEEQAESRAKTVKVLKVVGTVAAAAAITAGAIYAGKQMNSRAGARAIRDFDNSELRDIVQSGQLFAKRTASKSASVPIPPAMPKAVKPPKQLVKKAAVNAAKKAKPHAGKIAEAAKPHAQQFVINKAQERLARNAQKVRDLQEVDADLIANNDKMLREASRRNK